MALVQVRAPGEGFEYTQAGIIGLGDRAPVQVGEYAGAAVPARDFRGTPLVVGEPVVAPPALTPAVTPNGSLARDPDGILPSEARPLVELRATSALGTPRAVIKAARERTKAIRAELKRMAALKRELDELERLLAAAKQKPEPKVRALRAG